MKNWSQSPVVVVIGLVASTLAIVMFVTGRTKLDDFLKGESAKAPQESTLKQLSRMNTSDPTLKSARAPNENAGRHAPPTMQARPASATDQTSRYVVTPCGAIRDNWTHLEWNVGPDLNMTWSEAKVWVDSLGVCGGRWRMPSVQELKSLYEPSRVAGTGYFRAGQHFPAHIDPVFSAIGDGSWAWAADHPSQGRGVSFNFNQGVQTSYGADSRQYSTRAFAVRQER